MKVITSDYLESSVYRILFEYINSNEKVVHQLIGLMEAIYALPNREFLIYQVIADRRNRLDELMEKNKEIINYFRWDEISQYKSSLITKIIMNDDVLRALKEIRNDKHLIDVYLKNAQRLEALKVENILFGDLKKLMKEYHHYYCEIKKCSDRELKHVRKCYTDGEVRQILKEEEASCFDWCHVGYNFIPFDIIEKKDFSFVLTCENEENGQQKRSIEIANFAFDGSKLPTEEEISSYELPKELIMKNNSFIAMD